MTTESTSSSAEDDNCPLHFPPTDGDSLSILEAFQLAAESHQPLHLLEDITLSETIVLKRRQRLVIVGKNTSKQIQIAGNVHSLFLLNNHSTVELENLELVHLEPDGEDCTNVGAAVNLRYKASARIQNCSILSHAGFCCWAVQKASFHVHDCKLQAPLRSAVVCFGKAHFEGASMVIENIGVHGVCARGECIIRLEDSRIQNAAVRGLYAYANAFVRLERCIVTGTVRADTAAIEVLSSSSSVEEGVPAKPNKQEEAQKASSLTMNQCEVINNGGVGVRIRGGVKHNLTSNRYAGNAGGNAVDFIESADIETQNESNSQTNQLKRDNAGSSFRKGDWWCGKCTPKSIVHGSKDFCVRCGSEKKNGKLLSSEEVISLNRGNSIATWWFDGDDAGWLQYDKESSQALETAFQEHSNETILLSNGRYSVNLETMEQINTESHFLRLVQRRIN